MTMVDRIIRIGDIITVHTPIGERDFTVAKIDPTGKWAITEGHDWFKARAMAVLEANAGRLGEILAGVK